MHIQYSPLMLMDPSTEIRFTPSLRTYTRGRQLPQAAFQTAWCCRRCSLLAIPLPHQPPRQPAHAVVLLTSAMPSCTEQDCSHFHLPSAPSRAALVPLHAPILAPSIRASLLCMDPSRMLGSSWCFGCQHHKTTPSHYRGLNSSSTISLLPKETKVWRKYPPSFPSIIFALR